MLPGACASLSASGGSSSCGDKPRRRPRSGGPLQRQCQLGSSGWPGCNSCTCWASRAGLASHWCNSCQRCGRCSGCSLHACSSASASSLGSGCCTRSCSSGHSCSSARKRGAGMAATTVGSLASTVSQGWPRTNPTQPTAPPLPSRDSVKGPVWGSLATRRTRPCWIKATSWGRRSAWSRVRPAL